MQSASSLNFPLIEGTLSAPRLATYLAAAGHDPQRALQLYGWNAQVSAALMLPTHFAEISTRNAVDEALTNGYGALWPWNPTFERSLPNPGGSTFNPRRHLQQTRQRHSTTGKVIADLKFVFWASMFTARHDGRIWGPHIHQLFPALPRSLSAGVARSRISADLQVIRTLRNRLAHHEPIITRNLADDLTRITELIELRSAATSTWVKSLEAVSTLISSRP